MFIGRFFCLFSCVVGDGRKDLWGWNSIGTVMGLSHSFSIGYVHAWNSPVIITVGLVLAVAIFSSAHSLAFVVGIRTFNSYFQYFFRIKFYKGIHF